MKSKKKDIVTGDYKMNILFLCTYYHRAMIFSDSKDRLKRRGHFVKVFNGVVNGTKIEEKYKKIMNSDVIHQECFKKKDRFFYFNKQSMFYNRIVESMDINEYDIIHSHTMFNGGYACYMIKKKFGIPYIVSVRNTDINVFMRIPFFKIIANKIIREAAGIVFLSNSYKKEFINKHVKEKDKFIFEKKAFIIKNGLESFWLENKNSIKSINNNKPLNVLCVGKIDKNKNIVTTINALNILIKEGQKIVFTIVGKVLNKRIEKKILKLKYARIINYLSKEELINVYRQNDIYVMPSIHESFGRVYAEAMSQGMPIIYSKGQGFDGIYSDGEVGYSVPSKNKYYIANSIKKILKNYDRMSANCIRKSEDFNWDKISIQLELFYKKVLSIGRD